MENKGKFYITTAIAYASRKPHIGNTYDVVSADVIARYKRACGYDVFYCTGTDEHGQKIENYAAEAGVSPQQYVDNISSQIKAICELLGSTHTHFIRTTDDYHVKAVQKIFTKRYETAANRRIKSNLDVFRADIGFKLQRHEVTFAPYCRNGTG